jgi:hypothetical protein
MTAQDDQVDAAVAHITGSLRRSGEILKRPMRSGGPTAGPVADLLDRWRDLTHHRVCPHLRTGGPQPVIGFLALVGDLACLKHRECFQALLDRYWRTISPDECDACRRPAPGGRFHELTIQLGNAMLAGNACVPCFTAAEPDYRPPTPEQARQRAAAEAAVTAGYHLRGQCPHCNATSQDAPHPLVKGLTVRTLQHDDWCPVLTGG